MLEQLVRDTGLKEITSFQWPAESGLLSDHAAKIERKALSNTGSSISSLSPAEVSYAIDQGWIIPHYQPKVSLCDGCLTGFEALARWHDPDGNRLPPAAFIPVAEESGLSTPLTKSMVSAVLDQMGEWIVDEKHYEVSVNATTEDLENPEFPDWLIDTTERAGVPAELLVVELTESRLSKDPGQLIAGLSKLRRAGFGIAIDDFGTGYSSLEQLQRVPATELKIDRAFVDGAHLNHSKRVMLDHSVGIGKSLSLKVFAEGIETLDDWLQTGSSGADVCQGWFSGKPMPPDEIERWLAEWESRYEELPKHKRKSEESKELHLKTGFVAGAVVSVIAMAAIALITWFSSGDSTSDEAIPRIAVIPKMSAAAAENGELAGGLAEAITNQLAQLPGLAVIAATSTASLAESQQNPQTIGRELGADILLQVAFEERGDKRVINARFFDTQTMVSRWADSFTVDSEQLGDQRNSVIRDIARRVQADLGVGQFAGAVVERKVNKRAYDAYLLGLEAFGRRVIENLGAIGPTLANVLDEETFFLTLEESVALGHFMFGSHAVAPLYGINPYPDWVLEHPRYRALWESGELKILESKLKAQGLTAALPR